MFRHKLSSRGMSLLFTDSGVISREMSRYSCLSVVYAGQLISTGLGSFGFLEIKHNTLYLFALNTVI